MKKDGNSDVSGNGNSLDPGDRDPSGILVQFWDAGNGELMSSRLLEVNDAFDAQFSSDGHFLAIKKKFENVIELWNLEDSKNFQQFTHPDGESKSLLFSNQ